MQSIPRTLTIQEIPRRSVYPIVQQTPRSSLLFFCDPSFLIHFWQQCHQPPISLFLKEKLRLHCWSIHPWVVHSHPSRSMSLLLLVTSSVYWSKTTLSANLCRLKRSLKPYQNELNLVKDTRENWGKKSCNIDLKSWKVAFCTCPNFASYYFVSGSEGRKAYDL